MLTIAHPPLIDTYRPLPSWQGDKPRASLLMPDIYAIVRVALSMVAMIFLGPVFVLLLYALWLPRIYYKGRWTIYPAKEMLLPALIIGYSLLSTLWSAYRGGTLRAGVEFASVIACALIMARCVRIRPFIIGVTMGMCMALVGLIATTGLTSIGALTSALGSKNQLAANAEIGLYCAIMSWFAFSLAWKRMFFSVLPALFCFGCLAISHSATSNISFAAALLVSLLGYLLANSPRNFRKPLFFGGMLCVIFFAVVAINADWQESGLKAIGKNSTLTGRTFLWQEGFKTGMQHPFLGVGLGGFWQKGNIEAEKLWYHFGIFDRTGFHFHNLFINLFVDLGLAGVMLWAALYLTVLWRSIRHLFTHRSDLESIFYLGMASMYLMRSMAEVDTTGPYGIGPLLFFFLVFRILSRRSGAAAPPKPEPLLTNAAPRLPLPPERTPA